MTPSSMSILTISSTKNGLPSARVAIELDEVVGHVVGVLQDLADEAARRSPRAQRGEGDLRRRPLRRASSGCRSSEFGAGQPDDQQPGVRHPGDQFARAARATRRRPSADPRAGPRPARRRSASRSQRDEVRARRRRPDPRRRRPGGRPPMSKPEPPADDDRPPGAQRAGEPGSELRRDRRGGVAVEHPEALRQHVAHQAEGTPCGCAAPGPAAATPAPVAARPSSAARTATSTCRPRPRRPRARPRAAPRAAASYSARSSSSSPSRPTVGVSTPSTPRLGDAERPRLGTSHDVGPHRLGLATHLQRAPAPRRRTRRARAGTCRAR